jgi:hypothetical protein
VEQTVRKGISQVAQGGRVGKSLISEFVQSPNKVAQNTRLLQPSASKPEQLNRGDKQVFSRIFLAKDN